MLSDGRASEGTASCSRPGDLWVRAFVSGFLRQLGNLLDSRLRGPVSHRQISFRDYFNFAECGLRGLRRLLMTAIVLLYKSSGPPAVARSFPLALAVHPRASGKVI